MKTLNALFISDTHGLKVILERKKIDVIFHSGDFTFFEENLIELLHFWDSLQIPVFLIHGNHESDELDYLINQLKLSNVFFLHNKIVDFKNLKIAGLGGGGFSLEKPSIEILEEQLKELKLSNVDIFITHAPPYGTLLDKIEFEYVGNIQIREFIEKYSPLICSCGHLHENANKKDYINNTLIINPGYKGFLVKIDAVAKKIISIKNANLKFI